MDYLWFNLNPGGSSGKPHVEPEKQAVFANSKFRQAVSYAINRDGINRSVMLGLGTPQFGPISSGNTEWFDRSAPETRYSPERARNLLREAGLVDRNSDGVLELHSGQPLEIALFTSQGNLVREKTSRILQSDLAKVGLSLSVHLFPLADIATRFMTSFQYEAILFGIVSTDVVPDSQPDLWLSSGTFHLWHPRQDKPHTAWESELDALTSRLLRSLDHSARRRTFADMQRIWAREMPAIPTVVPNILTGWRKHVGNVRPSILMVHVLWNAEELTVRQSTE
jgi:peptide/nickel transport system substrate-binding protein